MRVMMLLEARREAGAIPSELIAEMGLYNEAVVKASVLFGATRPRVSFGTLDAMKRPSVRIRALRLALKQPDRARCTA